MVLTALWPAASFQPTVSSFPFGPLVERQTMRASGDVRACTARVSDLVGIPPELDIVAKAWILTHWCPGFAFVCGRRRVLSAKVVPIPQNSNELECACVRVLWSFLCGVALLRGGGGGFVWWCRCNGGSSECFWVTGTLTGLRVT